jgi:SAM-dependent methyltransferase
MIKETDIRPKELFEKYLGLCEIDTEKYFVSDNREQMSCPACGSESCHTAFIKYGFGYTVCDSCLTLYQNPRPPMEEFSRFYKGSESARFWAKEFFPAVEEIRREKLFKPKVMEIARLCQEAEIEPNVVADVGAGFGVFLEEWRHQFPDSRVIAIEPNPEMADLCRKKNLEVIENFAEQATGFQSKVDLVVALEVIEHVHDPLFFCTSLNHLLQPGGRMLLTGLCIDGFDTRVLWEQANSISPPHHINFMSIKGFEILLGRAGFSDICIFTPGKLDVDIVKGMIKKYPDVLKKNEFILQLMEKDDSILNAFQKFLAENQLSSHCWAWVKKEI